MGETPMRLRSVTPRRVKGEKRSGMTGSVGAASGASAATPRAVVVESGSVLVGEGVSDASDVVVSERRKVVRVEKPQFERFVVRHFQRAADDAAQECDPDVLDLV